METDSTKRNVDGYILSDNPHNGGIQCEFQHKGKKFYADVCYLRYSYDTECEIFGYNDNGSVNWRELYCKRNVPVTDESLVSCIKAFCGVYEPEVKYRLVEFVYLDGTIDENEIYESASLEKCKDTIESMTKKIDESIQKYMKKHSIEEVRHDECYVRYELYPLK